MYLGSGNFLLTYAVAVLLHQVAFFRCSLGRVCKSNKANTAEKKHMFTQNGFDCLLSGIEGSITGHSAECCSAIAVAYAPILYQPCRLVG